MAFGGGEVGCRSYRMEPGWLWDLSWFQKSGYNDTNPTVGLQEWLDQGSQQ